MTDQPTPTPAPQTPNKFQRLLTSRKFWAAILGLALILMKGFNPEFPVTEEQIAGALALIASYIIGTALDRPPATPAA